MPAQGTTIRFFGKRLLSGIGIFAVSMTLLVLLSEQSGGERKSPETTTRSEQFSYTVIKRYPHDPTAFTQGLVWDKGKVYESTGLYGYSSLRLVDLETGRVERKRDYPRQIFAEGITVFQEAVYQLTWKNNRVFQLGKQNFSLIRSWPFPGEGWGITHDGRSLIVSDGTATLYFFDPETLIEQRRIIVHDSGRKIVRLNELEYIRGAVYANIWKKDQIVIIRPEDGAVTGWIDLAELCESMRQGNDFGENVLNGIMYDAQGDRIFITGKLWPALFEIRLKKIP